MNNNILENLKIVLTVFLFVVLIVPSVKKIAYHIGAVDIPGGRHIHGKIIPKLGGFAIFLGFLLGYMLFCQQTIQMISILIGGIIILIFGIFAAFLLYIVALGVVNLSTFAQEGHLAGINPLSSVITPR